MIDFQVALDAFASQAWNTLLAVLIIIVFLVVGYLVAIVICWFVRKILEAVDLEKILEKRKVPFTVAGFTITTMVVFLFKVFIMLAFLGTAAEIITMAALVNVGFLVDVIRAAVGYIPMLIQGVILIMAALIFAHYITSVIRKSKDIPVTNAVAIVVQIFIAYVALVMALPLILPNVNVFVLEQAFIWFVGAAGIALGVGFGVAVGLGLKDSVAAAAAKHPRMFDFVFGEVEKKVSRKR